MSAYSKVEFESNDTVATENIKEQIVENSTVSNEVGKFDNSYEVKLQELYKEYDKITLDEEKIKSMTEVKVNAISSSKISFRTGLVLTTTVIVALLLAFLCIYNIFVINGMSTDINYLQGEVIESRYDLTEAEGIYNNLVDEGVIRQELIDRDYVPVTSSNVVTVSVPEKAEVVELQGETNWFDGFCNFLSRVFG